MVALTSHICFPIRLVFHQHLVFHHIAYSASQRWSRGHKARGQGHKKIRGQGQGQPFRGQTLSRPRTGMLEAKAEDQGHKRKCSPKKKKKGLHKNFSSDLPKKKRSSQKFFKRSPQKNVFQKNFSSASQNFNNSKKKCCPRAEDRPIFEDLRPQGQGQGLDLRGQGLQNVSTRTSSRPRTFSRTPPLLLAHPNI